MARAIGTDSVAGDLVVRKRRARPRIANRRRDARQIAAAPRLRRNRHGLEPGRVESRALVVAEEEQRVPHQRPSERAAENVLPALRLGRPRPVVRPGVGVHRAVPVELERVSVKAVRAGLDDVADDGAGDVSCVGSVVVGLDADLGQRVGTGLIRDQVVDRLVHVHAVNRVVVGLLPVPVDERPSAAEVADRRERARVGRNHARQEQRELTGIATVEGKRRERRAGNHLTNRGRFGLQHLRLAADFDRLLHRAELQLEINAGDLHRLQLERLGDAGLETGKLGLDDIRADRHRADRVVAGFVGNGGVVDVCRLIRRGHGCTGNGRAALIGDDSGQGRRARLRDRRDRRHCNDGKKDQSVRHEKPLGFHVLPQGWL